MIETPLRSCEMLQTYMHGMYLSVNDRSYLFKIKHVRGMGLALPNPRAMDRWMQATRSVHVWRLPTHHIGSQSEQTSSQVALMSNWLESLFSGAHYGGILLVVTPSPGVMIGPERS